MPIPRAGNQLCMAHRRAQIIQFGLLKQLRETA
jgi:hypothetical protein